MRRWFLVFILLFSAIGFAPEIVADEADASIKEETEGYNIQLKIVGTERKRCFLVFHYGNQVIVGDTIKLDENGVGAIKGEGSLPGGVYRIMFHKQNYFEFLIGDEQNFTLETDVANYIEYTKVWGSLDNILFNEYQRFLVRQDKIIRPLNRQLQEAKESKDKEAIRKAKAAVQAVEEESNAYRAKIAAEYPSCFISSIFRSMPTPDVPEAPKNRQGEAIDSLFELNYTRNHFWDNVDLWDARLIRTPILHGKVKIYLENLTFPQAEPSIQAVDALFAKAKVNDDVFKYVVNQTAKYYQKSNVIGLDAVYVHIAENYLLKKNIAPWIVGEEKKKIRRRLAKLKPNQIGNKAPKLVLNDRNGTPISMNDIDAEYTVVFFWDYECPFCQESMPEWKRIYDLYHNRGLEFYAVCINSDNPEMWTGYIDRHKLKWINVIGNESAYYSQQYNVDGTPTVYLLDKDKKIVSKKLKEAQLERMLYERLVKKPS